MFDVGLPGAYLLHCAVVVGHDIHITLQNQQATTGVSRKLQ